MLWFSLMYLCLIFPPRLEPVHASTRHGIDQQLVLQLNSLPSTKSSPTIHVSLSFPSCIRILNTTLLKESGGESICCRYSPPHPLDSQRADRHNRKIED
jgi:hypothetical protein